jgi:hypothetical protein
MKEIVLKTAIPLIRVTSVVPTTFAPARPAAA